MHTINYEDIKNNIALLFNSVGNKPLIIKKGKKSYSIREIVKKETKNKNFNKDTIECIEETNNNLDKLLTFKSTKEAFNFLDNTK